MATDAKITQPPGGANAKSHAVIPAVPASPLAQPIVSQVAAPSSQVAEHEGVFQHFPYPIKHSFVAFCQKWVRAYFGSLIGASVAFPIIASAATVCFYFSPGYVLPFVPSSVFVALHQSNWYAPVYGVIFALTATLIFAALRCHFATAEGANMHSYGLLKSRQNALKARLGIEDQSNGVPRFIPLSKMKQVTGMTSNDRCSESALREAYAAYGDVCHSLCYVQSGLQWVMGAGYVNAWASIHLAEEALIEVEPINTIIRGAMHDQEAIENSAINNSDSLLEKLIQAVKDLDPGASAYFKEHQPDKNYAELRQELKEQQSVLARLVDIYNKDHANETLSLDKSVAQNASPLAEAERRARGVLREVRHTLNTYRDGLWEGVVRARNHLLVTIALTGAVTFVLLCITMLLDTPPNSNKSAILAATAFYLVGAVAGLFARFYNESVNVHSVDDYGLFTARLIAVPLLSGLAGVGGVLVTVVLPVLSGQLIPGLDKIFTLNSEYLFAAAIFGFTPNLLIKSFQQRAQKYTSELESSKAAGITSDKH